MMTRLSDTAVASAPSVDEQSQRCYDKFEALAIGTSRAREALNCQAKHRVPS